jgi:hypothetical protein
MSINRSCEECTARLQLSDLQDYRFRESRAQTDICCGLSALSIGSPFLRNGWQKLHYGINTTIDSIHCTKVLM